MYLPLPYTAMTHGVPSMPGTTTPCGLIVIQDTKHALRQRTAISRILTSAAPALSRAGCSRGRRGPAAPSPPTPPAGPRYPVDLLGEVVPVHAVGAVHHERLPRLGAGEAERPRHGRAPGL